MAQLVPYSFNSAALPETGPELVTDTIQGVHFTVPTEHREWILEKIESWFDGRNEIVLVDTGISSKQGLGYIILEWEYREIDRLFLAILRDDELVDDYCVYERSEEEEL